MIIDRHISFEILRPFCMGLGLLVLVFVGFSAARQLSLAVDGKLHFLQEAFISNTAVQCGFCTSGMILTVSSLLKENPQPTREEIRAHLRGNLCRCTGYWNIFEAIETAVEQQEGGSE